MLERVPCTVQTFGDHQPDGINGEVREGNTSGKDMIEVGY